jgi:hypothetical protein
MRGVDATTTEAQGGADFDIFEASLGGLLPAKRSSPKIMELAGTLLDMRASGYVCARRSQGSVLQGAKR